MVEGKGNLQGGTILAGYGCIEWVILVAAASVNDHGVNDRNIHTRREEGHRLEVSLTTKECHVMK